jgi:transposase
MLTIGVDPHKQTHTAFAVNELGVEVAQRTVAVRREGFEQLLEWGRKHAAERSWVIEDVRNVSGSLERFLLDHGETVVRLPPQLMADARQGMRERGKSDPGRRARDRPGGAARRARHAPVRSSGRTRAGAPAARVACASGS